MAEWFKAAVLKTPFGRAVWYDAVRFSVISRAKPAVKLGRHAVPYYLVRPSWVAKMVASRRKLTATLLLLGGMGLPAGAATGGLS